MNTAIKGAAAGAFASIFGPGDTSSQSGQVPSSGSGSGSNSTHGCTIDSDHSGNCK